MAASRGEMLAAGVSAKMKAVAKMASKMAK
jgi:hypothetical protein